MQNFRRLGWVELGYFMVEDNKKQKKLIDFRGYPSPQLELELSWQVGAKVDQLIKFKCKSERHPPFQPTQQT